MSDTITFNLTFEDAKKEMLKGKYTVVAKLLIMNRLLYRINEGILQCKYQLTDKWQSSTSPIEELNKYNWAVLPDKSKIDIDREGL